MSYTALIPFKDGQPRDGIEFRNAWGGAARIWDALFTAHVPKKHQYDTWLSNPEDRRLWDLAKREDLQLFERSTHAFTFDLFFIRNEHFARFANDPRLFVEKYPARGQVDHLPAWSKWLEENAMVEAVGLYATSVSENPWRRSKTCPCCEQTIDETEGVPLSEGFEVYEWIESLKQAEVKA